MSSEGQKGCCTAGRSGQDEKPAQGRDATYIENARKIAPALKATADLLRDKLVIVPGGIFEMGARKSTFPDDLDSPRRKVKLQPFHMSPHSVSNADYAAFVEATGYRTVAEIEGWSFAFHLLMKNLDEFPVSPPGLPWWRRVDGAYWGAPEGPGSDIVGRENHPAVHIAWYDAQAYCNWSGLSLPTEAQWERAARGGKAKQKFPWGNDLKPGGQFAMNTFQGDFPRSNTGEDGWIGTAPVDAFQPNGYGLYNVTGNVWEWVADRFGPLPAPGRLPVLAPQGARDGYARVQRGGSYLCHVSYCDRYHVHSRTRNDPDSSTGNCGFRVASV